MIQNKKPVERFECVKCGCKMFTIKPYAEGIARIKYNPGAMFKLDQLRKRLKCVQCGSQYWDTEVILPKEELLKRIENREERQRKKWQSTQ